MHPHLSVLGVVIKEFLTRGNELLSSIGFLMGIHSEFMAPY